MGSMNIYLDSEAEVLVKKLEPEIQKDYGNWSSFFKTQLDEYQTNKERLRAKKLRKKKKNLEQQLDAVTNEIESLDDQVREQDNSEFWTDMMEVARSNAGSREYPTMLDWLDDYWEGWYDRYTSDIDPTAEKEQFHDMARERVKEEMDGDGQ